MAAMGTLRDTRRRYGLVALGRRIRLALADIQRGLRDVEPGQILLCALIGSLVGFVVTLLRDGVFWLHTMTFAMAPGSFLSSGVGIARPRLVLVPMLGGLLLGLAALWRRARLAGEGGDIVDPIEANALFGGRMSLRASCWLTFTTLLSNGAGASLGMEAGYTQLGAALFSRIGQYFRLRRIDLRMFVTAGAGAAIAAAFNAPLAGAFYGFEMILGNYNVRALAPVVVAAVSGVLTERSVSHMRGLFEVADAMPVADNRGYLLFVLLGIGAAGVGILAMQSASWIEQGLRRSRLPEWLRPALGGLALSLIAWFSPQVLGSGHGAIQFHFDTHWALPALAVLLAAKLLASAISVGSGFRGGLFSSSLFLGVLFGEVFARGAAWFAPALAAQQTTFMLAGMGAVAAGVVGAPLTMVFLVLEGTGDFPVTVAVVIAITVAATLVRMLFGYSFATWRFHLRGLGIRGAHDVGWIADMSVRRLMRSDPKCVAEDMGLGALRRAFPAGSAKRLYVTRADGAYVGCIDVNDLHDREIDEAVAGSVAADLAVSPGLYLLPFENIRTALARFDTAQTEDLPVLESAASRKVVGYMTEAYALKRYTQEMERMRSAELGMRDLFTLGPTPSRP